MERNRKSSQMRKVRTSAAAAATKPAEKIEQAPAASEREKTPSIRKQRFSVDPVSIIFKAEPEFRTALKVHCSQLDVEMSAFIREAILEKMGRYKV